MLTREQIERFHEDGYLAVDRLLDCELDIEPVIKEYQQLLDDLCERWVVEGRLEHTFSELPFEKRLVEVCLLYTSPSPRDGLLSRMPSSA